MSLPRVLWVAAASGTSSPVVVTPPQKAPDNAILCAFVAGDNGGVGSCAGFTQRGPNHTSAADNQVWVVLTRKANGEGATYSFATTPAQNMAVVLFCVVDVLSDLPIYYPTTDQGDGTATSTPVTLRAKGITVPKDNSLLLWFGSPDNLSSSTWTITAPQGWRDLTQSSNAQFSHVGGAWRYLPRRGYVGEAVGSASGTSTAGKIALMVAFEGRGTQPPNRGLQHTLIAAGASGGSTPVPVSDSGAGTDSISVAVTEALADSGSGTDSAAVSVALAPTDSGVGSDPAPPIGLPVSDSGAGSDAAALAAAHALADGGAGTDAAALAASLALADSGAGTDSIAVDTGSTQVPLTDSGSGSDSISVAASLSSSDTGAGADASSVAATLAPSDAGVGSDGLALGIAISDAATGSDAISIAATIVVVDAGLGAEAIFVDGAPAPVPVSTGSIWDAGADDTVEPEPWYDAIQIVVALVTSGALDG